MGRSPPVRAAADPAGSVSTKPSRFPQEHIHPQVPELVSSAHPTSISRDGLQAYDVQLKKYRSPNCRQQGLETGLVWEQTDNRIRHRPLSLHLSAESVSPRS